MNFEALKPQVTSLLQPSKLTASERLTKVCELLQSQVATYDWVGFYFANAETQTLHLRAFAGEPTSHEVIPFGKGICGQVAVSDANFVVDDVAAQDNYISCSIFVKSEIVIPLFKDAINIGQIDIDSHTPNAFTADDERFLEWLNQEVSKIL